VQPGGGQHRDDVRDRILRRLVSRAYRRPATDDEIAGLAAVAQSVEAAGEPFERGIQAALTAVLASPHFLYRIETHPNPTDPADVRPLDDHALATRLSYFLWSSTPDDALLDAAREGLVARDLHAHVDRMLGDVRADSLVTVFAAQWLQLELLDAATPDPVRFSEWSADLRNSMRREVEAFVRSVLLADQDVRDLIDAPYTYVDGRLAQLYGIAGVYGEAPRRVTWPAPARGGLLGQAGVLTMTSNPTRTSVVKRGKWVLEALLGAAPPPPPPGACSTRRSCSTAAASPTATATTTATSRSCSPAPAPASSPAATCSSRATPRSRAATWRCSGQLASAPSPSPTRRRPSRCRGGTPVHVRGRAQRPAPTGNAHVHADRQRHRS